MSHPSELVLEKHLLAPSADVTTHAAGCPLCTARLRRMAEEGETFRRDVYPRAVVAVREAASPVERPGRRWLLAALPVAAAAAALVLVVRSGGPGPDYVGLKGGALGLTVFVGASSDSTAVVDGARVALMLRSASPSAPPGRAASGSPRSTPAVRCPGSTRPSGEAPATVAQSGPLPGGAILDGQLGPERLYAVCTSRRCGGTWSPDHEPPRRRRGRATRREADRPPRRRAQATLLLEKTR
jgi:hypothetical protein